MGSSVRGFAADWYQDYCTEQKARSLKPPKMFEPCYNYQPRPGWEVAGCHSCEHTGVDPECRILIARWQALVPCLSELGGTS